MTFDQPVTLVFRWMDNNNDYREDYSGRPEAYITILKDGTRLSTYCYRDPRCDMVNNTFTIQVTSFSLFELVIPDNEVSILGEITAPLDPVQVNTLINVTADFTDEDFLDTHEAFWNWGDGVTSDGVVQEEEGVGNVTGGHSYNTPGVYTITLNLTDSEGNMTEIAYEYLVTYDPEGGFVTGGGWINSPEGAYTPDPSLSGKASFGFVSKYKKGADLPTGNTEFQFKTASFRFKSTSYQWLVVAGKKAKFKGEGEINGQVGYGFMISAVDSDPDLFRIKIWELDTEIVIYDNQMGAEDDADPVTALGGGSIVVHK
jgi:PKD repeat protein